MSIMLYKHPGKHKLHDDKFDYIVVDEDEVESSLKDGWYKTTPEAKKNSNVIEAEVVVKTPEREDLEEQATELGISFRSNTKDETLTSKINEALAE